MTDELSHVALQHSDLFKVEYAFGLQGNKTQNLQYILERMKLKAKRYDKPFKIKIFIVGSEIIKRRHPLYDSIQ